MRIPIKPKYKTIAEQVYRLKSLYPNFIITYPSHASLEVKGELKPTPRSVAYSFVLTYNSDAKEPPKIKITSPVLEKNFKGDKIPHIYTCDNLCLYRPVYKEFTRADFLSDTIIPWTSLWLYYYEVWHLTGEWEGGGEHATIDNETERETYR